MSLKDEGYPLNAISRAYGMNRSTYYKRSVKEDKGLSSSVLDEVLAKMIRKILDKEETFGYRRVWATLRFKEGIEVNIKKIHRIMKLKGWQCRLWNRPCYVPKAVEVKKSTVASPDILWSMDLTKIYCGQDGWASLIGVIDNGSREITGYRFSLRGRAIEATDALEQGLIGTYGQLKAPEGLRLRSDNGSIFLAKDFIQTSKKLGITQEFIPKREPEYNGCIERFFRTLKQECVWLNNFNSFEEAEAVVTKWINCYNNERLHSVLGYKTPALWRKQFYFPLAA